jgi:RNA polymerase sigma-70 factor (ECF subfamily)
MFHTHNESDSIRLFEDLLKSVLNELNIFIGYICKNKANSEDALQNTLIKAYLHFNKLKDIKKFKAWIFTIARRESFKLINKHKMEVFLEDVFCGRDYETDQYEALPEDILISKELNSLMKDIVSILRREYKDVIVLKYYHGLTLEEIARERKTCLNTVKTWHSRAKGQIHRQLKANTLAREYYL